MIWVTIGVETQDLTCLLSAKVRKWWTLIVCSILPHIKKRKVSLHVKMERKHRSVPLGRVHHMFWGKFYCRIFFCVDYFVDTLTHNDTESILGSNSILSEWSVGDESWSPVAGIRRKVNVHEHTRNQDCANIFAPISIPVWVLQVSGEINCRGFRFRLHEHMFYNQRNIFGDVGNWELCSNTVLKASSARTYISWGE